MNRLYIISIALAIAFVGTASARPMFQYLQPSFQTPRVVAGAIDVDGIVRRGAGFTAEHRATGLYDITFENGFWSSRCASLVVEPRDDLVSRVRGGGCNNPTFTAKFVDPKTGDPVDIGFDFIAVETCAAPCRAPRGSNP